MNFSFDYTIGGEFFDNALPSPTEPKLEGRPGRKPNGIAPERVFDFGVVSGELHSDGSSITAEVAVKAGPVHAAIAVEQFPDADKRAYEVEVGGALPGVSSIPNVDATIGGRFRSEVEKNITELDRIEELGSGPIDFPVMA